MTWVDQSPPATDVLIDGIGMKLANGVSAHIEIDKLPQGDYRRTVGNLFWSREIMVSASLEDVLREARMLREVNDPDYEGPRKLL